MDDKINGEMLRNELETRKKENKAYIEMLKKRAKLPAAKKREELLNCFSKP